MVETTIVYNRYIYLGCVDEFDQAKACGEADDWSEVSLGLFAAERDALEALEPSDARFDARAGFVEAACEEGWFVLFVGPVGNDGSDAARSRGVPIGLAGVALSQMTTRGWMSGPMSSRVSKWRPSKASLPVRSKAMISPEASDFAWIFVVKPPRERPSAWLTCPRQTGPREAGKF
jgi:hypothetical protein